MDKMEIAMLARKEYADPENAIRPGGINGNPFWNVRSSAFMYCPSFDFAPIPGCENYLFVAEDEKGGKYEFRAKATTALLSPIWDDLATGQVQLMVYAQDANNQTFATVGARSFHKAAPFTGNYPAAARDYRAAAQNALAYVYSMPCVQSWLTDGMPKGYNLYIYITKMVRAVVLAMLDYAELAPEHAQNAVNIAVNAADFLIKTSVSEGPLAGLPRTYYFDLEGLEFVDEGLNKSKTRLQEIMLIYPAEAGQAYLKLYQQTGDRKYYDAAMVIANYYRQTVCDNGTWPQLVSIETGKATSKAFCQPCVICEFLRHVYAVTGDIQWNILAENGMKYLREVCLKEFHWEGQFEDSPISEHYSNLTGIMPANFVREIAKYHADDEAQVETAKELLRYIEDQFVVWEHPAKYNCKTMFDTTLFHTPAGLEQYNWYVPIDGSAATAMDAFIKVHSMTGAPLLLEKACALADSITNMQNPRTGMIPTHWMLPSAIEDGDDMWLNCMIETARMLSGLADYLETVKK